MELLLVRHAAAIPRGEDISDPDRPLTAKGMRRFGREVDALAGLNLFLDTAVHSPWLRAAQTARLLADITEGEIHASAHLAAAPSEALLAEVATFSDEGRHALVGHEPWLAQLLAWLVTGNAGLAATMPFKKGGVALLAGQPRPGGMAVRAILPPRFLRRLGDGAR